MKLADAVTAINRRHFLSASAPGLAALFTLLRDSSFVAPATEVKHESQAFGRAKRIIFLFMSGGPSHLELFDEKPLLRRRHKQPMPPSVFNGQRLAQTAGQASFPIVAPSFEFQRAGRQAPTTISKLLPYTSQIVDDLAIVRSMCTDAVNHDSACMMMMSGNVVAGRPTAGSWVSYGLGSANRELPAFVVLLSGAGGQPITSSYWSNGFLPGSNQGVQFQSTGEPIPYLANPSGVDSARRRRQLDALAALNQQKLATCNDPEIATRIDAYEMSFRMQTSVPSIMDISSESAETLAMYGAEPGKPSFAANCLLARRLAERDVRFIQLFHRDWDHHEKLPEELPDRCRETDQASAALVLDLKQRGLLDSTLVVWGGEFGRTPFCQGTLTDTTYGRDHHPRCFTMWLAGGGVRPGITYGRTDEFGYNVVDSPVHIHDLNATLLHCLGIDHERLTFFHQGREFRLTDTAGRVVNDLLV